MHASARRLQRSAAYPADGEAASHGCDHADDHGVHDTVACCAAAHYRPPSARSSPPWQSQLEARAGAPCRDSDRHREACYGAGRGAVMPLSMLSMPGGRLIRRPLSRRLDLFACWRGARRSSIRRSPAVMMRSVPALAAWTAVMASFALAFGALKLGLWSAETPDFFEFRLSVLGRRAICRLWRCSVWRQRRGLC